MSRDEARDYFTSKGLTYSDIQKGDIELLMTIVQKHLDRRNETITDTQMKINKRLKKPSFERNGRLKQCELTMRSHYFNSREAIHFNANGFIGFAGWADDVNVAPLTVAFKEWVDGLALALSSRSAEPIKL